MSDLTWKGMGFLKCSRCEATEPRRLEAGEAGSEVILPCTVANVLGNEMADGA